MPLKRLNKITDKRVMEAVGMWLEGAHHAR